MTRIAALAPLATLALVSAPPAYIVGFVQDTNCAPLPGVQISIGETSTTPVVSDSQGRFVISVPDGRERVDLWADAPGFRLLMRSFVRVGPRGRDSHTLTLDAAGRTFSDPVITVGGQSQIVPEPVGDDRLRGEIFTTACTPIQDAQVSLTANGSVLRARSDEAGRFAFPPATHRAYTLEVRALGYIPLVRRETIVDNDTRPVRALLERGSDGETDTLLADGGGPKALK